MTPSRDPNESSSPPRVSPDARDITRDLRQWRAGDGAAFDRLFPRVYDEMRAMAHNRLRGEQSGHTFDTTALVHEAYLKLAQGSAADWQDRAHFFAVASRAMRRILIDHAKERRAQKRGGALEHVELDVERIASLVAATDAEPDLLIALDEALQRLEGESPRQAKAIELRYFGGLTLEEVGEALGISPPTAMRDLRFAQAWLARALRA